ncbi:MAG: TonB family protein [Acidobacteriia bacterium]|nr:TonB family protein [Terriglobia bacterium]
MNKEKVRRMEMDGEHLNTQATDPKSRGTRAKAPDVDALVFQFLEELDAVSAVLEVPPERSDAAAVEPASQHGSLESAGGIPKLPGSRNTQEPESDDGGVFYADVDAELARTLDELQSRPKSNVIPLTIREATRFQPAGAPEPAPPPEAPASGAASVATAIPAEAADRKEVRSAPPATLAAKAVTAKVPEESPMRAAALPHLPPAVPAEAPPGEKVKLPPKAYIGDKPDVVARPGRSTAIISEVGRLHRAPRRAVVGFAAVTLIAACVFSYRYFFTKSDSSSQAKAPSSQTDVGSSVSPGTPLGGSSQTVGPQRTAADPGKTASDSMRLNAAGAATREASPASSQAARNAARPDPSAAQSAAARTKSASAKGDASGQPAAGAGNSHGTFPPVPTPPPATVDETRPATIAPPQSFATQGTLPKTTVEMPPARVSQVPIPERLPANVPVAPSGPPPSTEVKSAAEAPTVSPAPAATAPLPLSRVVPEYPPVAVKMRIMGRVELTVEVDEQGRVTKATAVRGPSLLRPAAEAAVMKWQFKPATLRGVSIKSETTITVDFKR